MLSWLSATAYIVLNWAASMCGGLSIWPVYLKWEPCPHAPIGSLMVTGSNQLKKIQLERSEVLVHACPSFSYLPLSLRRHGETLRFLYVSILYRINGLFGDFGGVVQLWGGHW